jgi:hypothetical protein
LSAHEVPRLFLNMLLPLGTAVVALAAALAGYVMVKFFGVVFLGQPREAGLANAHDAGWRERVGMIWLAAGCVLLGLLPSQVIAVLALVPIELGLLAPDATFGRWWLLDPVAGRQASYAPLVFLAIVTLSVVATILFVSRVYRRRVRRSAPWDCGFARLDSRMQDTAEGFGQPIRHIFEPFFGMRRELPRPADTAPRYRVEVSDRIWTAVYVPAAALVQRLAHGVVQLQQGRISTYLVYSLVTLLVLLGFVL